jgi:GNAT superfamily N-acetyltransferase
MVTIQIAKTTKEIKQCFPVMAQLRPTLSEEVFLAQVKRQQQSGYHLAFLVDNNQVKTVAGFRISESLSWKKFLYVDDFITDAESRSNGYGDKLFDWLVDYAKSNQCNQLHLDSGVQRFEAHRFYLRKRMYIYAHHFTLVLK